MIMWRIKKCESGHLAKQCFGTRAQAARGMIKIIIGYFKAKHFRYDLIWRDTHWHTAARTGIYYNKYYGLTWKVIAYNYIKELSVVPYEYPVWQYDLDNIKDDREYFVELSDGTETVVKIDGMCGTAYNDNDCFDLNDVIKFKEVTDFETTR